VCDISVSCEGQTQRDRAADPGGHAGWRAPSVPGGSCGCCCSSTAWLLP